MCKLLGRIVKLTVSMYTRRNQQNGNGDGDTSRHYPVSRPSRETTGSYATTTSKSSVSARGVVCPASHVRTESTPSRTQSPSRGQMGTDGGGGDIQRKPATSSSHDQRSMYSREGREGTKIRDEFSPPTEVAHGKKVNHANPTGASSPEATQHLYETQTGEFSILQHEHRAALEERKKYADAYATLKHHYGERSKKLSAVRHERQAALDQRNEIDVAHTTLKRQYEEQTRMLDALHSEHQAAKEQRQKAEQDCAALKQKYETQKNEYSALNTKHQSLKANLEQLTSELQGMRRFVATTDTSGPEVVNTLRKLNEEVQQSTRIMAEWAIENFTLETPASDESQTIAQNIEQTRASDTLGMGFMQLLPPKKHKEDPVLLEMAFRAYLIYELYWIASPWGVGQEEQSHNVYIDGIYQRMREAEGQAISGNWRALTRAYTLPAFVIDPDLAHTIDMTVVTGFSDIILAAGCIAPKSDVTAALWTEFGEKVHHFVSLAGQVNKIIGVGVISDDFEVLVVWPDTVFDDKMMEDSYDNGDRIRGAEQRKENVLFATDLGLMQRMRVGSGAAQKGKPSELIIIKPKVALASVVGAVDE